MKINLKFIVYLFFASAIILIFMSWFGLKELSSGDSSFYWDNNLVNLHWIPQLWKSSGMGYYDFLQFNFLYLILPIKFFSQFTKSWLIIERLVWYFPFLILTILSANYLLKILKIDLNWRWIGVFIYLFNTYILMIVGGGQVSIFLAYSIFPLVIAKFVIAYQQSKFSNLIWFSLIFCLIIAFEPRYAILCLLTSITISLLLFGLKTKDLFKNIFFTVIIIVGINFYWLMPTLLFPRAAFDSGLSGGSWVDFLSVANFSNSITFLHPLWPENIFGKVSLMRPEFMLLPIMVFLPLVFVNIKKNKIFIANGQRNIFYVSLFLIIIGAFFSKGINQPFGFIYRFIYSLPFFNTFRDPVKFYFITAIGYMLALPLFFIYLKEMIGSFYPKNKIIFNLFILLFVGYWIVLLKPAITGQLNGTFKSKEIPNEYSQLENFLVNQNQFFRTFWIPDKQRFGYESDIHPAINSDDFISPGICNKPYCDYRSSLDTKWTDLCDSTNRCYISDISYFSNPQTEEILRQMSVKYIIIPTDPQSELFIHERIYSDVQRNNIINYLNTINWLKPSEQFGSLKVYEITGSKDLFFTENPETIINWRYISPTKYELNVIGNKIDKIYFSENFDSAWQLSINNQKFEGVKEYEITSFNINQLQGFNATLEFLPQRYILPGMIISSLTLLICIGYLAIKKD